MLKTVKEDYYRTQIENCNSKELFRVVGKMCNHSSEPVFPDCNSQEQLAEEFATFFEDKINNICVSLDSTDTKTISVNLQNICDTTMEGFKELTQETAREMVMESSTKSCPLDPIPIEL